MQLRKEIKFETLKKSHKKGITIGVVAICIVGSVLVFKTTRAKYRFTQSIPFVRGVINYKPSDLNVIAMYQENSAGTGWDSIDVAPTSGYLLNTTESKCEVNGAKDSSISITYVGGKLSVSNFTKKGTKCYVYFNKKEVKQSALLANYTKSGERTDFTTTLGTDNSGKVYSLEDDDGTSYYFAGKVSDNWVKFGKLGESYYGYLSSSSSVYKEYNSLEACQNATSYNYGCTLSPYSGKDIYWRIVRFNGDGTIRLIYNGITKTETGTGTQIGTSVFNSGKEDNVYVGYMYTKDVVHGLEINSAIKGKVDDWYKKNIVDTGYSSKVDNNAGFCGDRDNYTEASEGKEQGGGISKAWTWFGAYIRFAKNKSNPTFKCKYTSDLYTVTGTAKGNKSLTYPVGLITADEVVAAGGIWGSGASGYLSTRQEYWTMTPSYAMNAEVIYVNTAAGINQYYVWDSGSSNSSIKGIRPVINLRADTTFASGGDGTSSNPWVVE